MLDLMQRGFAAVIYDFFFYFHLGKYICSHDFEDKPVKKKLAYFPPIRWQIIACKVLV